MKKYPLKTSNSLVLPKITHFETLRPLIKSKTFTKNVSMEMKMKNLDMLLNKDPVQDQNKQLRTGFQSYKTRIDISDLWGNKEKYLMNTGYFNAYLNLKQAEERQTSISRVTRKQISSPSFLDFKAQQNVKNHISKNLKIPAQTSNQITSDPQEAKLCKKKCKELCNVLEKILQNS